MAKVKNFKTIFPAVSVPLNDDYSINESEFRAYLRWIKTFYGKGNQIDEIAIKRYNIVRILL